MANIDYGTKVRTLKGQDSDLKDYQGKVLLIINTASKCGFTPQYAGLEKLYEDLADQGLAVLGFPCNQFGKQEPGKSADIEEFCQLNYGVSFPMFEKVEVNGPNTHPLYATLKAAKPGLMGTKAIKWNFTKFLVSKEGEVLKRYAPNAEPSAIRGDIEAALRA